MICREKNQLDATQWFTKLIIRSTCFGHYYAHHQELETIKVFTACAHNTLLKVGRVVWCGAVGYASRFRDVWHIPDVVCTVLELLMAGGETVRNM